MDIQTRVSIDSITSDGTMSVLTETYVIYNGKEAVLSDNREGLTPLDAERAAEILPDNLMEVVKALWTEEIVEAYRARIAENEAE